MQDARMAQRGAWRRRRRLPALRLLLLLAVLTISDAIGAEGDGGATAEGDAGGTTPPPAAEPAAITSTPAPEVPPVPTCTDNCTKCSDRFAVPRHRLPPFCSVAPAHSSACMSISVSSVCYGGCQPLLLHILRLLFDDHRQGLRPRSGSTFVTVKCFRNHSTSDAAALPKNCGRKRETA